MKEYKVYIAAVLSFFTIIGLAFAVGANASKPSEVGREKFSLPEQAREVSPGVYNLGFAEHGGKKVEGYAFIHRKDGYARPSGCNNDNKCQGWEDASCGDCSGGNGGDDAGTSSCYGFLAKDAKWKEVEDYIVNATNSSSLAEAFVLGNIGGNIEEWESAAGKDILGVGSATDSALLADVNSPDNQNEVYFADIDSPGAIGVTIVWGIFGGPPWARELVEWDQVYDDVDFDWSEDCGAENCIEPGKEKMDFGNIATHELGHTFGLDDLYDSNCSEVTMYGYARFGETNKRSLEDGDINGVAKLYE